MASSSRTPETTTAFVWASRPIRNWSSASSWARRRSSGCGTTIPEVGGTGADAGRVGPSMVIVSERGGTGYLILRSTGGSLCDEDDGGRRPPSIGIPADRFFPLKERTPRCRGGGRRFDSFRVGTEQWCDGHDFEWVKVPIPKVPEDLSGRPPPKPDPGLGFRTDRPEAFPLDSRQETVALAVQKPPDHRWRQSEEITGGFPRAGSDLHEEPTPGPH